MATPQDKLPDLSDLSDAPAAPRRAAARRNVPKLPAPPSLAAPVVLDEAPPDLSDLAADSPAPVAPRALPDLSDLAAPSAARAPRSSRKYGAHEVFQPGGADWSIERAAPVKQFFRDTFGRDLPVSAFGQSKTHDARGLDHGRSMDVRVNPLTAEGKRLAEYFKANNIPFLAYNHAVPGAATGAHFHVGLPSHRLGARPAGAPPLADLSDLADEDGHEADALDAPDELVNRTRFDAPTTTGTLRRRGTRDELAQFNSQMSPQLDALGVKRIEFEDTEAGRGSLSDSSAADDEVERVNSVPASVAVAPTGARPRARESLDPHSPEDRERRDVAAAARVRAVTLPLPRALADYRDSSELMADAYRHGARSLNIDPAFVEEWIKTHGDDMRLINSNTGAPHMPADLHGSAVHDERRNTVRLNLGGLSDLERDYKAQRSTAARAVDWATDDTHSAGEKFLDVAAPVVSAAARVGDLATRPLQAASTALWSLARKHSLTEAASDAWTEFRTGATPDGAGNWLAEQVKGSETLRDINKNLPGMVGGVVEMVTDPGNLVPLGMLARGGAALRGMKGIQRVEQALLAGRDARFLNFYNAGGRILKIEAAPVAEAARSAVSSSPRVVTAFLDDGIQYGVIDEGGRIKRISSSEASDLVGDGAIERVDADAFTRGAVNEAPHFKITLKDADGVEHTIDTSAYYEGGQKPKLVSRRPGEEIEGVGLERDGDTGRIFHNGKPQDFVMDSDGTLRAAPVGGYVPPAAPVPAAADTLAAQVDDLKTGHRSVVILGSGSEQKIKVPNGMRSFGTPEGGRIVYNPAHVTREDVALRMDDGTLDELMNPGDHDPSVANVDHYKSTPARLVSDEVLRAENTMGRDVVVVQKPDGSRQAFYRSSGQNSGQAGEWFPFGGIVDGGSHDGWFNKLPFVRDELSDTAHPLHRYGSEENKRIGRWLKSQNIPEGVEVPRGELNARVKELGAFDDATERIGAFVEPERAPVAGDDPFAGITPTQVTRQPASANLAATLPDKLGDPAAPEWHQFAPEDGTLGIPRSSMPQIKGEHRGALVQFLKGRGITHEQVEIAPNMLKPSQAEWSPEKVNRARGFEGTPRSILVSSDGHVLDGHHQWLSSLHDAPDAPIPAIQLNAPIHQLLIETARFPSSGVDKASAAVASGARSADDALPDLSDLADEPAAAAPVDVDELTSATPDGANLTETIPVNQNPGRGRLRSAGATLALPERVRKRARDVQDLVNLTKAIPASFDNSALFGQGAIISGARPSLIPGAVADSARSAMSPAKFETFKNKLVSHPNQELREASGLYLASIKQGEETFGSRFAEKIPGVAASSRAYEATLDSLRSNAFDLYAAQLKAAGVTDPKAFKDIARWVNVATGRGELGKLEPLADVLNLPLFSPRLLASKFNVISAVRYARMHPAARRIALREMFRATGSYGVTLGLAKLAGADVDLDPFSPGFGLIQSDETSYDLSGGRLRPLRYAAQIADSLNRTRRGEKVKDDRKVAALTEKFFRAYLSPAGQLGADYFTGEDFAGNEFGAKEWKPAEFKFGELDRLMPFAVKEIRDAYREAGALGAVKAAPAFVGVGVKTREKLYPDPIKPNLSADNQAELKRLGLDLAHLGKDGKKTGNINPNYRTKDVTGDSVRVFGGVVGKPGREVEGMGVDAAAIAQEYSAELDAALTEVINSPDYEAFGDDKSRARYLETLTLNIHKRYMNGARRDGRGEQMEREKKVKERLDRLSGGADAPRVMNFKL